MTELKLRPYQQESIEAVESDWSAGIRRPAVILPTGMGKTVIFSHLGRDLHERGRRPLFLVHRDELVNQTVDKLGAVSDAEIGIIKAERNDLLSDMIVGSVQTLSRPARLSQLMSDDIGAVIVDEAHHAAADSYLRILEHFGCFSPAPGAALAVGFTATMTREDTRGLGDVWQKVSYQKDILYGIRHGYLCDVRGRAVTVDGLDLASVATSRGDYQEGSLGDALVASEAGKTMAEAYNEHARGRQGLIFAPNVKSATVFAADFENAGIPSCVITAATPLHERRELYRLYREKRIQVISSCGVLTEGFDMPQAEVAVIARATTSTGLYVQMVGRVLRPWPGKKDALVLDVTGVSTRHKLATIADLTETGVRPEPGESLGEADERDKAKPKPERAGGKLTGVLGADDVDLFQGSKSAWLQTKGGVWFIPTRSHTIFLWPDAAGEVDEHFKIGRCPVYTSKGGEWIRAGLPLEYAMAYAEAEAEDIDPTVASRQASWRVRRQKPSEAQIGIAAKYKIPFEGKSKSELSDDISIFFASRILDRR